MYVVTLHTHGYLPDAEPMEFNTLADAKIGLRELFLDTYDYLWLDSENEKPTYSINSPLRELRAKDIKRTGGYSYATFYGPGNMLDQSIEIAWVD